MEPSTLSAAPEFSSHLQNPNIRYRVKKNPTLPSDHSHSHPPSRHSPQWARSSSLSRLHDYTQTHHTR